MKLIRFITIHHLFPFENDNIANFVHYGKTGGHDANLVLLIGSRTTFVFLSDILDVISGSTTDRMGAIAETECSKLFKHLDVAETSADFTS